VFADGRSENYNVDAVRGGSRCRQMSQEPENTLFKEGVGMSKMAELSALRDQGLMSPELESLLDIQREDREDRIRQDKLEEE